MVRITDETRKVREREVSSRMKVRRTFTDKFKAKIVEMVRKRVLRIMSQENILVKARKSYKTTTNSNHNLVRYPNLIKYLILTRPSMVWNADITYIRILTVFVYLAALLDGFSRKIELCAGQDSIPNTYHYSFKRCNIKKKYKRSYPL